MFVLMLTSTNTAEADNGKREDGAVAGGATQSAVNVIENGGFEEMNTIAPDSDPSGRQVAEGYATPGTGNIITDMPKMVQVVGPINGVTPHGGNYMLRNRAQLGYKSKAQSYFLDTPMTTDFTTTLAIYIPKQSKYLQQIEWRRKENGQATQIRFTERYLQFCTNFCETYIQYPPLPPNRWNLFRVKFVHLAPYKWDVWFFLNGVRVIHSGAHNMYITQCEDLPDQIASFFTGDECQVAGCDGLGTVYFDDVVIQQ